jgi:phosphonate transport system substrate-binding protein
MSRREWGFGVARTDAAGAGHAVLNELCSFASEVTGERFAPHFVANYRELIDGLDDGTIGVAWMPPIPAVEMEEKGAGTVVALPARKSGVSYYSAFIVHRGGPRTLRECEGRRAAWVDSESASGYVIPRLHLASQGIDVSSFFSHEIFAGSHAAVVEAVSSGRVDMGATFCNIDPASKRLLNAAWTELDGKCTRPIEMIAHTGAIPNDAILAATKLPLPVRASLTRWLLQLGTREKDLFSKLLRASEFRVFTPAHFEPLKHMIRAARARGYTIPPGR